MRPVLENWGDLLAAVERAAETRDLEAGERLLARMQKQIGPDSESGKRASALFYEGVFAERTDQLERAERCFTEVVELDRFRFGDDHEAVADALNSLAMVQARAGNHEQAVATYERCADVYTRSGSSQACPALVRAAQAMVEARRYEQAEAVLERAARLLDERPSADTRWSKVIGELLHRCYVPRELHREALSALAEASRAPMGADVLAREAQARVWCSIGHMSIVFAAHDQGAAAYQCALELAHTDALRAEAREGLARIGPRFAHSLDRFRVVYVDARRAIAHVMQRDLGLFIIRDAPALEVGTVVEIDTTSFPTRLLSVVERA